VHATGRFELRDRSRRDVERPTARRDTSRAIHVADDPPRATRAPGVEAEAPTPPDPTLATFVARDSIEVGGWAGLDQPATDPLDSSPVNPSIAVGPEHVFQSGSRQFRVTDRDGNDAIDGDWADFFSLPTNPVTYNREPRVLYDAVHARWLAMESSWDCQAPAQYSVGTGYLDFAISATADPTGAWYGYYIPAIDAIPTIPAAGTSTTMVSLVTQVVSILRGCGGGGGSFGWQAFAFDWSTLMAHPSSLPYTTSDLRYFESMRPAVQQPASSSALYFLGTGSWDWLSGDGRVLYLRVTGSVAAGTATFGTPVDLAAAGIVSPMYQYTDAPHQPGDTVKGGLPYANTNVVWQAGRLDSTMSAGCTTAGDTVFRHCVRVTELSTSTATPTLTQDYYLGAADLDSYLGGAAFSDDGTLHVVWNQSGSGAGAYISSLAAQQLPSDPAATIGTPDVIATGGSTYTPYSGWTMYQAVAPDPQVPSAAWQGAPYAGDAGLWTTRVSKFQPGGATYVPLAPVRVLDSRVGTGVSGAFKATIARSWQVAGVGGIPSDAIAVTGNVTVTGQGAAGYVAITPTATNNPPTSTLNFPVGDNRANNLAVPLSSTGGLAAVYRAAAGTTAHVIFDVTGYFTADDSGATFTPIAPVRLLDSRTGTGLSGAFTQGTPRTLAVAGTGAIPAAATAITGNLTVTGQTAAGFLAVTKEPDASPSTSSLNFPVGDTRANGVYAALDANGALSIVYRSGATGSTAHVILDVTGYFVPDSSGLHYVPMNPSRVLDTRSSGVLSGLTGTFLAGSPRTLDADGHWGIPQGAEAITANLTVTGQTSRGFVSETFTPTATPTTSTINFPVGDSRANGVVAALNGGATSFVFISGAGAKTHLILDVSGYFK
jgi:hypothetical protein